MKLFWPFIAVFMMLRPLAPILDYMINYDYIADELCVNRDKPELNCNGRCYLMQALADEASKKKDAEERGSKNNFQLNITYFFSDTLDFEFVFMTTASKEKTQDRYKPGFSNYLKNKLIKPPIFYS